MVSGEKMKVVAVVVTYNRKKLLKECLEAILNQTKEVDNIVLIDNDSMMAHMSF